MLKVEVNDDGKEILVGDRTDTDSLIHVIDRVDSFPVDYQLHTNFRENVYFLLSHDKRSKLGFVLRFVVEEMKRVDLGLFNGIFEEMQYHEGDERVKLMGLRFKDEQFHERNAKSDQLAQILYRKSDLEEIKGWRNEKYTVYQNSKPYILIERSMAGLLGILTSGIHVNGYTYDKLTRQIKFWIPRRSKTKPTWPYMLDNIIAGGISYPYSVHETVHKEAVEEANLDGKIIERYLIPTGYLSYMHYQGDFFSDSFQSEKSFIVGEHEYIYDLELPEDVIPTPNDGEVDSFNLLTLQEILDALYNNQFKPNCGLVMVDFLIRHGYLNTENEVNYEKIIRKMHRKLIYESE
ncbi:hypothetical protein TPHA_0B00300 [Tetrapisispora phaffii CBS 4417]|uniref:Nudix hydrolase domain-containing protein n=1 Tax=Tetrapisispora phaffii (strain ATCC 24235 / CBS 4417 / NBRC 1672 / NRRL Y-8282 / UCD 70-5) TaxID=1071381 RepID=G8BQA5_TETPH|nr:hypothetical protein TPHA_0B00300 [Tetrapisispora phaffii CBS 4417]CCE61702.1 hypothetical protein TPHA_0B00300 [Tetrapisispora phaffii CBS 4417]